jgi:hypothetical protein
MVTGTRVNRDSETYLTEAEIHRRTGRVYHKAQCKALAKLRVPFQVDVDGRPLVLRAVDERMGGLKEKAEKRRRPRLDGLASV